MLHPRCEGIDQAEGGRRCSYYVAQHFVDVQFGNCDDTHTTLNRKSERQDMRYVFRPILGKDLSEISMGMV